MFFVLLSWTDFNVGVGGFGGTGGFFTLLKSLDGGLGDDLCFGLCGNLSFLDIPGMI